MKANFFFFVLLISLLGATQVKADTIYYQVPGNAQICQDPIEVDTFVFYHPFPSSIVNWSVSFDGGSFVSSGYGDSLLLIPTMMGNYTIVATYSGIPESFTLNLFSTPPSHADFTVLSGGEINTSHDTAWMCEANIVISANVDGTESTYREWTNSDGFYSTSMPVTITSPGKYYFERGNPCGTTVDSIQVVALPTTLPVWDDELFCNEAVNVVLDAGAGWEYTWSHGPSTQSVTLTEAGTYTVTATNVCTSISSGMSIEHQEYPLPNLFQYHVPWSHCGNEAIVMDLSEYTYDSYAWSVGGPILSTANTFTATVSDNYGVTVTQGSCIASDLVSIDFFLEPMVPEICIVTVDPTMTKNKIVWTAGVWEPFSGDPNYSPFVAYNIYKWAGADNWTFLGSVDVAEEHAFVDMNSNPPVSPERYKITALDECGVESDRSYYHQTITLQSSLGSTPGQISLTWTEYKDESNSFQVGMYEVWRGTSPENLEYIASTPYTLYNDTEVWGQVYYQIVALRPGGCDPVPNSKGTREVVTGSVSNITNNVVSGVAPLVSKLSLAIYPNPSSTGIFQIEGGEVTVTVTDNLGRIVYYQGQTSVIDLSGFAAGVYTAHVSNNQGSTVEKLIIQ